MGKAISMICETDVKVGEGVVFGSEQNRCKVGSGSFLGAYDAESSTAYDLKAGDHVPVRVDGVVLVRLGGDATAGTAAVCKADGSFENVAETAGTHPCVGLFLETGVTGEFVNMIIDRHVAINE